MKALVTMAAALALALPVAANAQAYSCALPRTLPQPRPDLPDKDQPKRVRAIGGYTLAISWSPQACRNRAGETSAQFQCARGNRFGFTLHGLWPDGKTKEWPQYCRATGLLPERILAQQLCTTPDLQLIQHEWAKHGTCTRDTPAQYFARARRLYARLHYPDMDALSRRPLTAGGFAAAMARANPGLGADMLRITANRSGWLEEIWVCLDTAYRYRRCSAFQRGLAATAPLKIWRGTK
ncbi:ribonuclease T [Hephaestia sp. GCM10023244]|uniref:ribonuclease T2 family protein n=1 Tax=unclassified Hephaestia TaxID=2631281 RepID=UPI0020773634|nr:ribonuclease T [Hephaestia sp. MAHUQ-44]MCM8730757.1 ribonuclease T [Hephaestia sp. MAHUQ-44]